MDTNKLRQKILDLAIHGKLVPQDPNDEPASVLLERIKTERVSKNPSDKRHYENITENVPFEIPESWEWLNLKSIGEVVTGSTPSKDHTEYYGGVFPFYKPSDLEQGINTIGASDSLTEDGYAVSRQIKKDSILVTCIGATIGKTGLIRLDGSCNQQINAIIPSNIVIPKYLYYNCISSYFQNEIKNRASATTLPILNKNKFLEILLPIPPINEQKRIVAKIEQLFNLIDVLESNQNDLESFVKQAKTKILDLAICGKLVSQDPNDEPASELLKRINPNLSESCYNPHYENAPFEIPESWLWITVSTVADVARGGSPRPIKQYITDSPDGVNWIKIGDAENGGKYIDSTKEKILKEGVRHSRYVKEGDFLLTNSMSYGKPYILRTNGCIHDGWLVISPHENTFDKDYLYYLLSSRFAYTQFLDKASGAVVSNLNKDKVSESVFPLPPLNEQKRIVAKIEQLFSTLDTITTLLK